MKFDTPKFDGETSFNIWKVQMMVILSQYGLKKALGGKVTKPASMTDEQWEELEEEALLAIKLCLASHVLREVLDKTTMADLWLSLEKL